ncbi:MAG: hypothetical protein WBP41_03605 [Saprospiraceae bacterium]
MMESKFPGREGCMIYVGISKLPSLTENGVSICEDCKKRGDGGELPEMLKGGDGSIATPGIYFTKIISGDKTSVGKFIKL